MPTILSEAVSSGAINASMFDPILAEIKSMLPIVIPVIVGMIAFKKGFGFLKSSVKGA